MELSLVYSRFHRQAQVTQRHHALQPKPNYFVSDCCRALLIAERYKKITWAQNGKFYWI